MVQRRGPRLTADSGAVAPLARGVAAGKIEALGAGARLVRAELGKG